MPSSAAPALLFLLLLPALSGPALAQDPQSEAERPARESRRQEQETRAADAAAKLDAGGADVTYEQILERPDDLALNYRYARAQVRRGDLKGAAATLERMLLVDPNRSDVRLFYAVVLYRLDNVVEAERELDVLASLNLPEPARSEVQRYRDLVAKRRKKTLLSARLGLGLEYDSNRNAAPSSGNRLFLDTPIPLTGSSRRQEDVAKLLLLGVDLRRSFGGVHEAFASVNYYRAEQNAVRALNLQAYSVQAGAALTRGRNTLTPALVFDHVLLAQSSYLRDRGVDVRLQRGLSRRGDVYVEVRDVFEDFLNTQAIPTGGDRTGLHVDVTVGGDWVLDPSMRVGAGFVRGLKRASQDYDTFTRNGLLFNHVWLPGRGTFLLTTLNLFFDRYQEPDPFVGAAQRADHSVRLSSTFGAPLALLRPALKDFLATLTYEYYHAGSNVENYAYHNHKVAALLTYKWDLGF